MRAIYDAGDTSAVVRAALKLSALLALRPGELRKLEWSWATLDGDEPLLRLPEHVMKARREHLVPPSSQAIQILTELRTLTGRGRYVLPAMGKRDTPMDTEADIYRPRSNQNPQGHCRRAVKQHTNVTVAFVVRAPAPEENPPQHCQQDALGGGVRPASEIGANY